MELYLFLILCVVPCVWIGAANGSHDFLTILFSAIVWGYWLFTGFPVNPILMGISVWFILSTAWSSHARNSVNDLLMILALFTVVMAVQSVDKVLAMLFSFIPAAGMAGLELYCWYKKQYATIRKGALFGNPNHSGVYFAINTFIGFWLSYNFSLLFLPASIMMILGTIATNCRGAMLALCIGICVMIFRMIGIPVIISVCSIAGIIILLTCYFYVYKHGKEWTNGRFLISNKAFKLIIKKPVWGWGLGTFKKEHQEIPPATATHRVHNDVLEIAFETGLVGLALIMYFFYSLSWQDPFVSAAIVTGIVSSCFFFTFRESHTAAPLMILCGLSLPPVETVAIPWIISGVVVLAILNILWTYIIKQIVALIWYGTGSFKPDRESQERCVENAVKWYPSTEYLARHAFFKQYKNPGECYDAVSQMIYRYDGRVVLWEALDQMARASYRVGAVNLADYFNHKALTLYPEFPRGLQFRTELDKLFNELKEKKNGTMAMS